MSCELAGALEDFPDKRYPALQPVGHNRTTCSEGGISSNG